MRAFITLIAVGASILLHSAGALAQCTTAANTWPDLNGAGGAPCFDGTSCAVTDPDFTTAGIGIYGSEAYLLDDVQSGAQYTFDMCSGVGAGAWIPAITIVTPSGAIDAFNLGTTGNFAANCAISWTATESGTYIIVIHESGAACGTTLAVDNGNPTVSCGPIPAVCPPPVCDAGVLDISLSPISLCPGETFDIVTDGSEGTDGGFAIFASPQPGASGGLNQATFVSNIPSFPIVGYDNDLNGLLSSNSLPPLEGTWAFYTVAYSDPADPQASACSISADSLMVTFLTAQDAACIPCTADAGTITAVEAQVCLVGGTADISATADGNIVIPSGYQVAYGVSDANGVIVQVGSSLTFPETAVGDYTIHTLVFNPLTLNPALLVPGVTTVADINGLLIQGGGTICGSLDLVGALVEVVACVTCTADAGTLTAGPSPVCLTDGSGTISATADGNAVVPVGYSTGYALTDVNGVVQQIGVSPTFTVTAIGDYTIHTLVYDPLTLNPASLTLGVTTAAEVNALLIQGGGSICGSLDLVGAPIEVVICCTADAGTLTAGPSPTCVTDGSGTISATADGNAVVPAGYNVGYAVTDVNGVVQQIGVSPTFTVTTSGDYTIHTLVYDPLTLNPALLTPGVTTAAEVNALLIQGGGTICGSLDLVGATIETIDCAPCLAEAGTITADVSPVCLVNGSADLTATAGGSPVVPPGYQTSYVLTQGAGLTILDVSATAQFTVTAGGEYTIHTLVFDPLTGSSLLTATTGFEVNSLLVQGGGVICGALDVVGAAFVVEAPEAGTLSVSNPQTCLINGSGTINATANGDAVVPTGYSVLYGLADASGTIQAVGASASFPVTATGDYTVHTLIYDPNTLDVSLFVPGFVTITMVNQAVSTACASFDASGVSVEVITCAQCDADAGTLTIDENPVCLENGTSTVSATADGNAVVPSGFSTGYAVTDVNGVVVQIGFSPSFTITTLGDFTIHTLVFDPLTLNPASLTLGVTTAAEVNALLIQGGGVICGSLDLVGAPVSVIDCFVPCTTDAGTLTATSSSVCLTNGTAGISANPNGDAVVPTGYLTGYAVTDASGVIVQIGVSPTFTVTALGSYTIHTLIYDPLTLDPALLTPGVTTAADVNALLIQGGGSICGSLDLTGAAVSVIDCSVSCTANAGTLTAVTSNVCLTNGTATITATPNGNAVVPSGYSTGYALTNSNGVVIQIGFTPSFTVTAAGTYTIHTLVFDQLTLNPLQFTPGVTTAADVNALLIQGGGSICGSLDLNGADFIVQTCVVTCNVSAGSLITSSPLVCLFNGSAVLAATHTQNPSYPVGFSVIYLLTDGAGTVLDDNTFPVFTVTVGSAYTIHTLVYDPLTLDPSSVSTGSQLNALLEQGGGSICGALDLTGAAINVPTGESSVGVILNVGDSLYLENASSTSDYQWFFNGNPIPGATSSSYVIIESGNYAVQYTGTNGCEQSSGTLPFTFSGGNISVEEHTVFRSMVLFPNPNNGQFSIRGELSSRTDVNITVTDVTGRVVSAGIVIQDVDVFTQTVDISNLTNGFYFVRIQASEGETTVRFVKQ